MVVMNDLWMWPMLNNSSSLLTLLQMLRKERSFFLEQHNKVDVPVLMLLSVHVTMCLSDSIFIHMVQYCFSVQ